MRSQLRRDAIPYLSVQPPAVQQHKMTISFADCLPPDVVHPLPFSFTGQKAKYANSTQLMLAMPNAAGSRPLGICSRCSRALLACPRSARSAACRRRHPVTLRPLPAKAASRHRLVAVNDYRPPLSGLVQQLKFHHRPELGPPSRVCCCSAFCSVTICRQ